MFLHCHPYFVGVAGNYLGFKQDYCFVLPFWSKVFYANRYLLAYSILCSKWYSWRFGFCCYYAFDGNSWELARWN